MRWDDLFDDLESQLEQELGAEDVDLRAEEERLRLARLGIRDRLLALHRTAAGERARALRLILSDGSRVIVVPGTFGKDWFSGELLDDSGRRPACLVPIDSIAGMLLARDQVEPSLDPDPAADRLAAGEASAPLSARLGLAFVLRDLCRRRQRVELVLPEGMAAGTIDRVGRDHLDLAVHESGTVRRESSVTEYRVVRIARLLLVRL